MTAITPTFEVADPTHVACRRDGTVTLVVHIACITTPASHRLAPNVIGVSDRGKLSALGVTYGDWGESLSVGDVYSTGVDVYLLVRPPDSTGTLRYVELADLLTLAQDSLVLDNDLSVRAVFPAVSGFSATSAAHVGGGASFSAVSSATAGTPAGKLALTATFPGTSALVASAAALLSAGASVAAVSALVCDAGVQSYRDLSAAATFAAVGDFTASAAAILSAAGVFAAVSGSSATAGARAKATPATMAAVSAATAATKAKLAAGARADAVSTISADAGKASTAITGTLYALFNPESLSASAPSGYDTDEAYWEDTGGAGNIYCFWAWLVNGTPSTWHLFSSDVWSAASEFNYTFSGTGTVPANCNGIALGVAAAASAPSAPDTYAAFPVASGTLATHAATVYGHFETWYDSDLDTYFVTVSTSPPSGECKVVVS